MKIQIQIRDIFLPFSTMISETVTGDIPKSVTVVKWKTIIVISDIFEIFILNNDVIFNLKHLVIYNKNISYLNFLIFLKFMNVYLVFCIF